MKKRKKNSVLTDETLETLKFLRKVQGGEDTTVDGTINPDPVPDWHHYNTIKW